MPSIAQRLSACGAVRFGSFTLTSGATSRYYVDVKTALTDPEMLEAIAAATEAIVQDAGPFDAVAGMELGAVPYATAVSLRMGLPLLLVRKEKRSHGTGRRIEGRDPEGLRVLVVEDVTTSGGSTLQAVQVLREAGATVDTAVVVVDRASGGRERLQEAGVLLHPLATVDELLATQEAKEALS